MAIYHLSIKTVSRSTGRSSVAASAGVILIDHRTGMSHNFTNKSGVLDTGYAFPMILSVFCLKTGQKPNSDRCFEIWPKMPKTERTAPRRRRARLLK